MQARKVQVKLYATEGLERSLESFIPVFHRIIQQNSLDEMVFDVADYTHVPKGPGVLLVGHGSDYAVDEGEGRPGVFYSRKRDLPEGKEVVTDALSRALKAADFLNKDEKVTGPKAFDSKEILFRFPDRIAQKNDDKSFEEVKPAIEAALAALLPGKKYSLKREGEPREPLTIRATS